MRRSSLNRYVWIGAAACCVWSAILPLVPLRFEQVRMGVAEIQVHRALSQQEKLSIIAFGACATVLLLAPLGIGWFVAQKNTCVRAEAKRHSAARHSALSGALSVSLGMLPLTKFIVFWNFTRSLWQSRRAEMTAMCAAR